MAGKTIELDDDAYARLEAHRQGGESLSDVIKRLVPASIPVEKADLKKLREQFAEMDRLGKLLDDKFYEGVEAALADRRRGLPDRHAEGKTDASSGHERGAGPAGSKRQEESVGRPGKVRAVG